MWSLLTSSARGRRWLAGTAFVFSATLGALGLAACDNSPAASPVPTAPPGTMAPRSGEVVFARYCNVCHPGGGAGSGPSLVTSRFTVMELKSRVRQGYGRMPPFGRDVISDQELNALAAYVQGLRQ